MKKSQQKPIRTRFAKDIVAEVVFPKKQTGKVALLAIGAPTSSSKKEDLVFLASHGYVAIFPRYRGTWESDGWFLETSPAKDIRDVIIELAKKKEILDIATGEKIAVKVARVDLFGGSFGGPAVLMNTDLPIVKKVIARAPVIDWGKDGADEPFDFFVNFSQIGFGGMYRTKRSGDWQKLLRSDFYNPIAHTKDVLGEKVFILHAKDDTNVPCEPSILFAEKTGASLYLKPKGGHGISMRHKFLWKKIDKFLKGK